MKKILLIAMVGLVACEPIYREEMGGNIYTTQRECVKSHIEYEYGYYLGKYQMHPVPVCDSYAVITTKNN